MASNMNGVLSSRPLLMNTEFSADDH